jgi:hypothetical protein
MVATIMVGALASLRVLVFMVFVFSHWGVWGALAVCVLTDLGAAFVMKEISLRAGVETLVIAVFVIIGVRVAPHIARLIVPS